MKLYGVCGMIAFLALACGSTSESTSTAHPDTATAAAAVAVSGTVRAMRIPASETLPAFSQIQLQLYDATAIWNDTAGGAAPKATPLYSADMPSAQTACVPTGCAWQISAVATAGTGPNIVARIWGSQSAAQSLWAPVYTTIVDANALLYSQQHHSALVATADAFALSQQAIEQAASQLALTAAELLARGLVIGMVLGKDAANQAGGMPSAMPGAQVALTAAQAQTVSLYYPNAAYTSPTSGTATNADGVFWLVGKSATGTALGTTTLAISLAGSNLSWDGRAVALMRNSVVVAPLSANQ